MPCSNGMVDQDEPCDPSSPGGVFLCPPGSTCSPSCTCNEPTTTTTEAQPTTTTSTTETPPSTSTTSTTIPETCGNGMVDQGEPCDPSSPGGAFLCPPGSICSAACTCQEGTTTSTTAAPTTTTTSTTPGGSTTSTSTTITGATTTSTTLPVEICGNCIDDDSDGAIDFEDSDCCGNDSTNGMEVTRSVFKRRGAKTRMKLRSIIGVEQTLCSLALTHDVFLQMKRSDGELLCAWVPAMKFMTMGKHMVSFWDLKERVESAKGIRDMAFTCKSDGAVRYYAKGPKVRFRTPGAGDVEITLGFRSPNGNAADNRCHAVVQEFRTAPNGLRAP